jgi:hypothetical protein
VHLVTWAEAAKIAGMPKRIYDPVMIRRLLAERATNQWSPGKLSRRSGIPLGTLGNWAARERRQAAAHQAVVWVNLVGKGQTPTRRSEVETGLPGSAGRSFAASGPSLALPTRLPEGPGLGASPPGRSEKSCHGFAAMHILLLRHPCHEDAGPPGRLQKHETATTLPVSSPRAGSRRPAQMRKSAFGCAGQREFARPS